MFIYKKFDKMLRAWHMKTYSLIAIEIIAGAIISVFSFLFFIKLAEDVLTKEKLFVDTLVSYLVYTLRTPELTEIMVGVSYLGGGFIVFASIFILIFLLLKGQKREAVIFSVAIIGGMVLNLVIKAFLQVPRPTIDPLVTETFYSFPSGHAMNSFIFYAMVTFLFFHYTRKTILSIIFAIIAACLVMLIGFSRVYLGVHYPTDVIAGWIAGFWWFVTVLLIDKTLLFHQVFKEKKRKK